MLLSGAGVDDFVKVLDFGISQASWRPRLTEGERVAGHAAVHGARAGAAACASRSITAATSSRWPRSRTRCSRGGSRSAATTRSPCSTRSCTTSRPLPSKLVPALGPGDRRRDHARARQGVGRSLPERARVRRALRAAVQGATPAPFVDAISEPPPVRVSVAPAPLASRGAGARAAVRARRRASRSSRGSAGCGRPGATPSG